MHNRTLPTFFWLILPIVAIIVQIIVELSFDSETLSRIHSEGGPHEIGQEIVIVWAFGTALYALAKINWTTQRQIGLVLGVAALGCFYIAGEEISWGQQLFHWGTPESWARVNDQDETNLHNTSAWLDQKPRLLLFIGICVAGLIVPALRRWNPRRLPSKFAYLYPSDTLAVTSLCVLVPYVITEIGEHAFGVRILKRVSEVQELFMYYFVALYVHDLYKREIRPD